MFLSLSDIGFFLEQYGYWFIFPLATFESISASVLSGFLVHFKYFNFYFIFLVLILADLIGDFIKYELGRHWRESTKIKKYGYLFGYSLKSEKLIENHFINHKAKTIILAKISPGLGTVVQIGAGIAQVNIYEFIKLGFFVSVLRTFLLMTLGYFAGNSYTRFDSYIYFYSLVIIVFIFGFIIYKILNKYIRNYLMKNNDLV